MRGPLLPGTPWFPRRRPESAKPTVLAAGSKQASRPQLAAVPVGPFFRLNLRGSGYGLNRPRIPQPTPTATGLPLITRVPDPKDVRRLATFTERVSDILNSLMKQGQLARIGISEWSIDPSSGTGTGVTGDFNTTFP